MPLFSEGRGSVLTQLKKQIHSIYSRLYFLTKPLITGARHSLGGDNIKLLHTEPTLPASGFTIIMTPLMISPGLATVLLPLYALARQSRHHNAGRVSEQNSGLPSSSNGTKRGPFVRKCALARGFEYL